MVVKHPFLDEEWLSVAGRTFGWAGPVDRQSIIAEHFGTLLPEKLTARKDKATFDAPIFSDYTGEFVRTWDGGGLDPTMIDVPVLRGRWSTVGPDIRTHPAPNGLGRYRLTESAASHARRSGSSFSS